MRAELLFFHLKPTGLACIQLRLLADIAGLIESEYVTERLHKAATPEEVIDLPSQIQHAFGRAW